ncbi:MAG: hypothetical protein NTV01_07820 [Bacteroidia bacterium]|nr:hypothetical protein [Bacteroidia bacterium]
MKNLFFYTLIIAFGLLAGAQSAPGTNLCPPPLGDYPVVLDTGSIAVGKF